jgi:hypothetical protein
MSSEYDKGKKAQREHRERLRANTTAVEFIVAPPGAYEPADDRRRKGMHRVAYRSQRHPSVETFVKAPMRNPGATWQGATKEDWTQATFLKRLDWEENAPRFLDLPPKPYSTERLTVPLGMIDFWYDKAMYGKVDMNQQPIFFSETYALGLIEGNLDLMAPSFVAQAWRAFNAEWSRQWRTNPLIWDGGVFKPSESNGQLKVESAWRSVHPGYQSHMEEIFTNFQRWTFIENRRRKILTFKDFVQSFLYYFDSNAPTTPVSLSGYILSRYCPRSISGFQIELAADDPSDDLIKKQRWQNDPNFEIFIAYLQKYGFMLDFNIPSRVVADVTSTPMREFIRDYAIEGWHPGKEGEIGASIDTLRRRARDLYREKTPEAEALAQKYSAAVLKYQTKSLDIMFRTCYYRSDSQDLQKLMNYLCTFWNDYVSAFPTEVVTQHREGTSGTNMETITINYQRAKVKFDGNANPSERNLKDPFSILGGKTLKRRTGNTGKTSSYDVWTDTFGPSFPAKFYFFIRAREGAVNWSQKRFDRYVKIMTDYQKNFDGEAALSYINSKIQRLPSPGGNPAFRTVEHPSKLYSLYESRERSRAGAGVFMLKV